MKKLKIIGSTMVVVFLLTFAIAGTVSAADSSGPLGPNPLAGDGNPDGSSLDSPNGPNGYMMGLNQDA